MGRAKQAVQSGTQLFPPQAQNGACLATHALDGTGTCRAENAATAQLARLELLQLRKGRSAPKSAELKKKERYTNPWAVQTDTSFN